MGDVLVVLIVVLIARPRLARPEDAAGHRRGARARRQGGAPEASKLRDGDDAAAGRPPGLSVSRDPPRAEAMTDELEALLERPGPGPHRTTIVVDGVPVETLADLPPLRDRLLFVGLNPSPVSVEAGHYFQGRLGRAFWRRLITAHDPAGRHRHRHGRRRARRRRPRRDRPPQACRAPRDEATDATLRAGVGPLWQKVAIWRPAAIVFVYKRAAEIVAGAQAGRAVGPARRASRCRAGRAS